MASHHHFRHQAPSHHQYSHCHPETTTNSTICFCCYCYPNNTPSHYHPPVPDPHPLHLHPHANFYYPYPNCPNPEPPYTTHHHHHHQQQPQYHPPPTDLNKEHYFHQLHHDQQTELTDTHPTVSSLLRRISALEFSLRHHSASHVHTLRDAAARTIQTHFRAFLVRRSRTLRLLTDLASIKSSLNILKSSVSENPHFDPQSLSRKALKLLFKLDSIQGSDPMIRNGKKSISRELTRLLNLIDGFIVKKPEISARVVKKNFTRTCGNLHNDQQRSTLGCRNLAKNKTLEDLVDMIDSLSTKVPDEDLEIPGIAQNRTARLGKRNDGLGAKVKKSVSFMENGKVYKVHRNRIGPVSVGDCDGSGDESYSVGANGELQDDIRQKAEEVGGILFEETQVDEEDQSHDGESSKSSGDGEECPVYKLRNEDGGFAFSAPLPVKMGNKS